MKVGTFQTCLYLKLKLILGNNCSVRDGEVRHGRGQDRVQHCLDGEQLQVQYRIQYSTVQYRIQYRNSRYKIKVEQLSCADTDILAPAGCVTYSDATSGSITSFNNANGAGEVRFYIILPVSFSVSYAANNKFFRR